MKLWRPRGQGSRADSLSARFRASCWHRPTMQSLPRALCSSPTRRSSVTSSSVIDCCCNCSTAWPTPAAPRSRTGRGSCCRIGSSGHRYRTCPQIARPIIFVIIIVVVVVGEKIRPVRWTAAERRYFIEHYTDLHIHSSSSLRSSNNLTLSTNSERRDSDSVVVVIVTWIQIAVATYYRSTILAVKW